MNDQPTYEELTKKVKDLERKALESKQLEDQFEKIFNLSLDMIGSGTLDGYFTKINSSFGQILGYSDEEFLAKPFVSFVHDHDIKETKETLEAAVKGQNNIYIINKYRCVDGSYKWIEWKVFSKVQENKFIAIGRDISTRKQIEEALQESEKKYRVLFENNEFLSYITDSKGNILLANRKGAKFMGYSQESIIGKSFFEMRLDRVEMYQRVQSNSLDYSLLC